MLFSCDPCSLAAGTTAPHNSNRTPADLGEILGQEEHSIGVSSINFAQIPRPRFGFRFLRIYPHFPLRRKTPPPSDSALSENLPPLPASERPSAGKPPTNQLRPLTESITFNFHSGLAGPRHHTSSNHKCWAAIIPTLSKCHEN